MKKQNLLKLAFTMMAMVVITGAMAQIANSTDYVRADADTPADVAYITTGKTLPFFAMPDVTYHPSYSPSTGLGIATGFTWNWTVPAGVTLGNATDNYVELTAGTGLGDFTINVVETPPVAWGTCTDVGQGLTLRIVAAPELVSFPHFASLPLATGGTEKACAPYGPFNANIELSGFPNFQVRYTLTQQAVDLDGTPTGVINTLATDTIVGGANDLTRVTAQTYIFDAGRTLDLIAPGTRTQYVYAITGVTDNVSRKSDYLGAETLYGTPATFTFIINPTPTTGPIYHIPNDFGNL